MMPEIIAAVVILAVFLPICLKAYKRYLIWLKNYI